jgi:hypothetical protein
MNPSRERKEDDLPAIPPPLPPFRSVSMMAPPAMPMQQSFSRAHVKATYPSQGKQLKLHKSHSTPFTLTSAASTWTWKVAQVAPVPLYHPLERTAISSYDSVDIITERISSFMKAHSVQCSYQEDMARVNCSTDCCVHFAVQLWKKNSDHIIIEVQRRQGCAIAMQALRQQLTHCILHGEDSTLKETSAAATASSSRACSFLKQMPLPKSEESLGHCLELCQRFLQSDLLDQNRLGLESLCTLTDPSKVLPKDAQDTSSKMLQDATMQKLLLKYFKADTEAMGHEEHLHGTLHLLALKALAHALETSKDTTIDLDRVFWQTVLQAYYKNIQQANQRPIEASLSIRSLRLLQALEPSTMATMQQPLGQFLQVAHEYGRQHSRSLQKETELLMMKYVY